MGNKNVCLDKEKEIEKYLPKVLVNIILEYGINSFDGSKKLINHKLIKIKCKDMAILYDKI